MKKYTKSYGIPIVLIWIALSVVSLQNLRAQDTEKHTVRLSADYFKIMNQEVYFDIKATSKIDRKTLSLPNLNIHIFNEYDDESVDMGSVTTDMDGKGRFTLKSLDQLKPDSTFTYTMRFTYAGNDTLKRASKSVSFKDAIIKVTAFTKDSINYISATLSDARSDSLMADQYLNVQVQRMFRPLKLGEDFYTTDEEGSIIVPVEKGIPGLDGAITLEVVLKDNDDYGTVKATVNTSFGVPFVEESTFDERTMWSPRSKTPLFLLIFPNLVNLAMWCIIGYLIFNLFKIARSKQKEG